MYIYIFEYIYTYIIKVINISGHSGSLQNFRLSAVFLSPKVNEGIIENYIMYTSSVEH